MLGHYTGTLRFIPTPQQGADNWSAGVTGATQKWSQGIANTQKDQAGRAVAAQAQLKANFNQSVDSGEWAAGVMRGGTPYWKAQSAAKSANYGTAATAGKDNYAKAAAGLYPYEAQLAASIDAMPSGSVAASKARVGAWIDGMVAVKGQFRA